MDALLEERAEGVAPSALPKTPWQAAQAWFARPETGPENGLYKAGTLQSAKRLGVVLLNSGKEEFPTIDVIDQGVGIPPEALAGTILSLQAGNKITKRYQIGAFGQGGSSTLGFSDYVFIASRYRGCAEKISFTIIRVLRLDASYKEDCYAYLVDSDLRPLQFVLDSADPIKLYQSTTAPDFPKGTVVRHFEYRLTGLSKALSPSPGNLYHYLHYSLLDPLLPFRIWDLRSPFAAKDEYVGGSRNRLMKLAETTGSETDTVGRVKVKHHRPMEFIVPSGSDQPTIGVEYWVVLAYRKGKEGGEDVLRSNSAELFVQPHYPIIGTMNGQTQGELPGTTFKELGLTLLGRHMIVHIDASAAESGTRRQLFSTNREGFKEGPVLDSIVSSLKRMLEEDAALLEIEKELTERLAKRESATTKEEVRRQVTKLLKDAGLQVAEKSTSEVASDHGERRAVVREHRPVYRRREPLATLPFPQVTFIRFAAPEQHLEVALQDSELVLVETDADAEFDKRGLVAIRSSGDLLEVESKAKLAGGRVRWRLRPAVMSTAGSTGELTATITKPNGEQLAATISFEILPAKERPARTGRAPVPPFEIKAISPEDIEHWEFAWPDDVNDSDAQKEHAYRALSIGGKTWVYYSTVFPAYTDTLQRLKSAHADLVNTFTTAYEVWIAYHAILQMQSDSNAEGDERLGPLLDKERAIVAAMQVKQALQYAEMWKRGLTAAASTS
jgi:hypothetical protein